MLNKAIDCGVNFIDTADVYGDRRRERLIAQLKKQRKEEIIVAAGRRGAACQSRPQAEGEVSESGFLFHSSVLPPQQGGKTRNAWESAASL
jgi:aryl-alcohol dehydrogenase-like predicted oxidoreductase